MSQMKILVVDDDTVICNLLEKLLKQWGYLVETADNGVTGLEMFQCESNHFNAIIIDWTMPSMDGVEFCRRVRNLKLEEYVYLIMLTGNHNIDNVVTALKAGADDFISKPVHAEVLSSRLLVAERIINYEREIAEKNSNLTKKNDLLGKYASQMESLARDRAEQLIHAERLSSLGELSAGIAHEVNNYLAPILGYTELLRQSSKNCLNEKPDDPTATNCDLFLDSIQVSANRIKVLMERIRSHARQSEKKLVNTAIDQLIDNTLELCINHLKMFQIEKNISNDLPEIMVDSQKIEQVLINLFKNAADAMEGKRDGILRVEAIEQDAYIKITVEDNGPGIPEEDLNKIWESFFTTKNADKGTGLGLSICRGIIRNHNGGLSVENRPEGGTRFIIDLPTKPL